MATISKYSAVAKIGPLNFTGVPAWLAWLAVHLIAMVGFKNRVTTLLSWIITFVGDSRNERVSTMRMVFARNAMDDLGHEFAFPGLPRPEDASPGEREAVRRASADDVSERDEPA